MKNKKKIKYIVVLLAIVVIFALIFVYKNQNGEKIEYVFEDISKNTIIQTVSETGTVKSENEISLSFANSGKIAKINVSVGDKATSSQVLAELDYSDLEIRKQEALANLDVNISSLNKLLAGATVQDIAVMRANVDRANNSYKSALKELEDTKNTTSESVKQAGNRVNDLESESSTNVTSHEQAIVIAETNLENAKITYQNSIDDYKDKSITIIEDSISKANNSLDAVYTIISDSDIDNYLSVKNISYLSAAISSYDQAKLLTGKVQSSLSHAKGNNTESNIIKAIDDMDLLLSMTYDDLVNCFMSLENSVVSTYLPQTSLDAFKASMSSQQSIISASITSVQAIKQSLNTSIVSYDNNTKSADEGLVSVKAAYNDALKVAKDNLINARLSETKQNNLVQSRVDASKDAWDVIKVELARLLAPANTYDIQLAQARVKQAQSAIDSIEKQIDNSIIKSFMPGTVTRIRYEVGEQVTPNSEAISILGNNDYEIEVLISEADITKVKIDDSVEITYDAYGEDLKFEGKVFFIEPAETVVQDVIYYKVKIGVGEVSDVDIRSGMTANVIITTIKKDNVIAVPSRAVIDKNGDGKFVKVMIGENKIEERKVELGLRGDGGVTEVLSGVEEGDRVVTYIKDDK